MNRLFPRHALSRLRTLALSCAAIGLLSSCASRPEGEVYDPWEGYNRGVYNFNEGFDRIVLKPITKGYMYVVPEYGRERVHNVISNLNQPVVFVNSVLQGDPENAFSSLWSFVLNSTLGIAGIFDFAGTNTHLRVHPEDFGQTLAVWGAGSGPYFVLPILGPSTVRDTGGVVVDFASDPFNYYVSEDIVIARTIARAIDARAQIDSTLEAIYKTSLDPYATIRSGYFQRRAALIKNRTAPSLAGGDTPRNSSLADPLSTDPAAEMDREMTHPSSH